MFPPSFSYFSFFFSLSFAPTRRFAVQRKSATGLLNNSSPLRGPFVTVPARFPAISLSFQRRIGSSRATAPFRIPLHARFMEHTAEDNLISAWSTDGTNGTFGAQRSTTSSDLSQESVPFNRASNRREIRIIRMDTFGFGTAR